VSTWAAAYAGDLATMGDLAAAAAREAGEDDYLRALAGYGVALVELAAGAAVAIETFGRSAALLRARPDEWDQLHSLYAALACGYVQLFAGDSAAARETAEDQQRFAPDSALSYSAHVLASICDAH